MQVTGHMQLSASDLRHQIIRPTLAYLGIHCPVAEELLLTTATMESELNPLCKRDDGIGIYQITAWQHRMVWDEYLAFQPDLASSVRGLASQHRFLQDPDQELGCNLSYATAIAWLMYQRSGIDVRADANPEVLCGLWQECFHPGARSSAQTQRFRGCLDRYHTAA